MKLPALLLLAGMFTATAATTTSGSTPEAAFNVEVQRKSKARLSASRSDAALVAVAFKPRKASTVGIVAE